MASSTSIVYISLAAASIVVKHVSGHATLVSPDPRGQDGNLWYQVGCQIGCNCSGTSSKQLYVTPASFGCTRPMEPTNNNPLTRSWNVNNLSPEGDYAKYNPWRAPGHAVPISGCGVASGFMVGGFERFKGGEKTFYQSAVPTGYKAGEVGTNVPAGVSTKWTAGGTADISFAIDVNHGGGYQYRLCPKSAGVATESCFQQNPLSFATGNHTIHYSDGSRSDFLIPAVDVTEGVNPTGSAWRRFPVPACNCDLGAGCSTGSKGSSNKAYEAGAAESGCPTGLQYPKSWDEGYGYYGPGPEKKSTDGGKTDKGKASTAKKSDSSGTSKTDSACLQYQQDKVKCGNDAKCKFTDFGDKGWWCYGANSTAGKKRRLPAIDEEDEHDDGHEHRMLAVGDGTYRCSNCGYIYDPSKHAGKSLADQPSTWKCPTCSSPKSVFKPASEYMDELGTKPANGYRWHIVDKVVVPNTPGDYVLSWRWDCEQTPQIWTNCADISIVPEATSPQVSGGSSTGTSPQTGNSTNATPATSGSISDSSGGTSHCRSHQSLFLGALFAVLSLKLQLF